MAATFPGLRGEAVLAGVSCASAPAEPKMRRVAARRSRFTIGLPLSECVSGEHPVGVVACGEGCVFHDRAMAGAQQVFDLDLRHYATPGHDVEFPVVSALEKFSRSDVKVSAPRLVRGTVDPEKDALVGE